MISECEASIPRTLAPSHRTQVGVRLGCEASLMLCGRPKISMYGTRIHVRPELSSQVLVWRCRYGCMRLKDHNR